MKLYDGKVIRAHKKEYLILRKLQPKGHSYQYEVYDWNPPQAQKLNPTGKNLIQIAQSLNMRLPVPNPSNEQVGNTLWEES